MEILVGMTTQNRCVALSPQLVHKVAVCPEPCINKCREVMCLDVLPLSLSLLWMLLFREADLHATQAVPVLCV